MKTRILITVKTYPNLTQKEELVCTAGITEDGRWIRIYPVPFRKLDYSHRYKKFQWITVNIEPAGPRDRRPESHKLIDYDIQVGEEVKEWETRKDYLLNGSLPIYDSREKLLAEMRKNGTSLAIFKPNRVLKMTHKEVERAWPKKCLDALKVRQEQGNFLNLDDGQYLCETAEKIPYVFRYQFEDVDGHQIHMMVEDWEIGMLFLNTRKDHGEAKAVEMVKEKYMKMAAENDIYFFLGTSFKNQQKNAPNPFLIVGVFAPPKTEQLRMW